MDRRHQLRLPGSTAALIGLSPTRARYLDEALRSPVGRALRGGVAASYRTMSVLNRWNQAWEVPSLFVADGACMGSSANQNPSLTCMALTARACDYAVRRMDRNER